MQQGSRVLAALLLPVFLLFAQDAGAQARPQASQQCRLRCSSITAQDQAVHPDAVRMCLARCAVNERVARNQGTQRNAGNARVTATTRPATPARAAAVGAGAGVVAVGAAAAAAPQGGGVSVVYAAVAPAPGYALGTGADRGSVHRDASARCSREGGCRLLGEFTERCVAVTRAVEPRGLIMTSDPGTYDIRSTFAAGAPEQSRAEAMAMAECESRRTPNARCRVLEARCR